MHENTIAYLELGTTKQIGTDNLVKIALALGVMVGDLLQPPSKRKGKKRRAS